jgi:hypothetical protein
MDRTVSAKPPHLRRGHALARQISPESIAIYNFYTGRIESVPHGHARALSCCDPYRPAEEVRNRLIAEGLATDRDVDSLILDLQRRELLLSDESLAAAMSSTDGGLTRLARVGMTTRNRAALLGRSGSALESSARKLSRPLCLQVIEDSTTEEAAANNRIQLARLVNSPAAEIHYASRAARRDFANRLSKRAGIDPQTVEFALLGDSQYPVNTGAGRNCLLLANAGEVFLLADDDLAWRVAKPPKCEPGLALTSSRDPTHFWFYTSPADTEQSAEWTDVDYLQEHELMLGKTIGECVLTLARTGALDLSGLSAESEWRMRTLGGRIAATSTGIVGDSGTGGTAYLFLEPESHERVIQSEPHYRSYVTSRQVLRCVARNTVGSGDFCMAGNLGLDHRSLLPPFLPVDRNSDGLFGTMLRRCFPRSYFGFVPAPILHEPDPPRSDTFERIWGQQSRVTTNHIVTALFDLYTPPIAPCSAEAAALDRVGGFFGECGSMSERDLNEVLRIYFLERFAEQQRYIELSMGDEESCPPFFAKYLQKYLDQKRSAVLDSHYVVPADLRAARGLEGARSSLKAILCRFGQLLRAWSALVEAAKILNDQGLGLTAVLPKDGASG